MKKIAIIGTAGIPSNYGGFETLAHYIAPNLAVRNQVTVFCSSKNYDKDKRNKVWKNVRLNYTPLSANGKSSILYDIISMVKALPSHDTYLVLGVSGAIMFPLLKYFFRKRLVVNIDGIEWKRNKWGGLAKRFLKFSERIAVKYADEVVCDNKIVLEYVRKVHKKEGTLISYGGDHTSKKVLSIELKEKYPILKKPYFFKVARIEPENNLHIILEGFSNSQEKLVIVGNWLNSEYGKKLKEKYSSNKNILLLDPIYNLDILDQFRSNAQAYVHGHSAGGTNPSLVEAMNLGLPVIAYNVNFNIATMHGKGFYFKSSTELTFILNNYSIEMLNYHAKNLEELAKEYYTWDVISKKYESLLVSFMLEDALSPV